VAWLTQRLEVRPLVGEVGPGLAVHEVVDVLGGGDETVTLALGAERVGPEKASAEPPPMVAGVEPLVLTASVPTIVVGPLSRPRRQRRVAMIPNASRQGLDPIDGKWPRTRSRQL